MESVDLDMDDVFGDDVEDGEDIGAVGPLPDLPESTQYENEDADNAEVDKRLKALSKGAAKKVVRKPQPKLDADRLTGTRGIPILPKLGEKLKFKGKNNEAADLKLLMREMEHWAHRLFPSMPFDEVIQRVEKLGSKSAVKTCIKKIRLDMPLLDEDFVGSDHENEDDVERNEEGNTTKSAEAMWEELIEEDEAMREMEMDSNRQTDRHMDWGVEAMREMEMDSNRQTDRQMDWGVEEDEAMREMEMDSNRQTDRHMDWGVEEEGESKAGETTTTVPPAPETPGPSQTLSQTPSQTPGISGTFTPEQLERMERNRQLALERKLKKRGIMSPGLRSSQPGQGAMYVATPLRDVQTTQPGDSQESQSSLTQNSDSQMSEIIEAGSSENIVIDQRQNAQLWCTQTENSDNKQDTDSCLTDKVPTEQTSQTNIVKNDTSQGENMDSEVVPVQNGYKSNDIKDKTNGDEFMEDTEEKTIVRDCEVMSEIIPTQNCHLGTGEKSDKPDITNEPFTTENIPDTVGSIEDMSEVLPVQTSQNVVLKPVSENCVIGQMDNNLTVTKTTAIKHANETISANGDKENLVNGAQNNDLGKCSINDGFDDELTEEQLIESLDH